MTDHHTESPTERSMVNIVMDPTDNAAITKAALNAHDPTIGRITLHPTPSAKSSQSLAHDLLDALGKPIDRLQEEGIRRTYLQQTVLAWLSGESHQQILVLRSHLMDEKHWTTLLDIHKLTGIQVVFIYHAPRLSSIHQRLLSNIPHQINSNIYEFLYPLYGGEYFERPWNTPSLSNDHLPTLPNVDFPRFRAEMFRRLSVDEFAAADAEYVHGIETACRWLSAHDDYQENTTPYTNWHSVLPPLLTPEEAANRATILQHRYTEEEIKSLRQGLLCLGRDPQTADEYPYPWRDLIGLQIFLSELVNTAPSTNHTLARIRGAQAGFLLHGLLLNVPAEPERHPGPGVNTPLTPALADQIRRSIAHPQRAAALACVLLTYLNYDLLHRTPVSALSQSAHQLRINDRYCYTVPPHIRGLLRAARSFVQLHNPTTPEHSPLLEEGIGRKGQHLRASAAACNIKLDAYIFETYGYKKNFWHEQINCWWIAPPLHCPTPDHKSHNKDESIFWNIHSSPLI